MLLVREGLHLALNNACPEERANVFWVGVSMNWINKKDHRVTLPV